MALLCVLLLGVPRADAQQVQVRELERTDGRAVYEMTAEWSSPLKAAMDAKDIRQLAPAVQAVTAGLLNASRTIRLPRQQTPPVRVLAADYETYRVPPGMADETLRRQLARPAAYVTGIGMERRRPAGTLALALVRYDAERETLRRYSRLVVAVSGLEAAHGQVPADPRLQDGRQMVDVPNARAGFHPAINSHLQVANSVLADGTTYKFSIDAEGIYRVDYDLLQEIVEDEDLRVADIDPRTLKIYGNGGEPLPALNGAARPADLVENPIWVQGGGDGSFDEGDAVYFYAEDVEGWRYSRDDGWSHYKHDFSRTNTYFLKIGGASGQRITGDSFPGYSNPTTFEEVTGRYFVEPDEFNWHRGAHGGGLTWWSTQLSGGDSRTLLDDVSLPGRTAGEISYEMRVAVRSSPQASVLFEANGTEIADLRLPRLTLSRDSAPAAYTRTAEAVQAEGAGGPLTVTMSLENVPNDPKAALDWLRILYPKRLQASGSLLRFATPAGAWGEMEFVLRGFDEEPRVWDVTEPGEIRQLAVASQNDAYRMQIALPDSSAPREIIAFRPGAAGMPDGDNFTRVATQNLHGISSYPDLVIIAPDALHPAAERLAERRRAEGLQVTITGVKEIYNEFSGGVPDMRAVRDYLKFLYDRADSPDQMLRYALLFGDGHYNYRRLGMSAPSLANWIFPYETEESLDNETSYTSDDYFTLLDDQEGRWPTPSNLHAMAPHGFPVERPDIGIGRLPVQTLEEAQTAVDKIATYEDPSTFGPWRLRYLFVADDGPTGVSGSQHDQDLHVQNAEVAAERLQEAGPLMNVEKIYGPTYERVYGVSWRIPQARQDILTELAEGVHVFNYSGHGGEEALTQERIFSSDDIPALDNDKRLPVFVTVTCSFGRWDMPNDQSGGELVVLREGGGSIAAFTTVRVVYTSSDPTTLNPGLNRALIRYLFARDAQGRPLRMGDVMRLTKNTDVGLTANSRKFNYLGDPSMRFGLPSYGAEITQVNGQALADSMASIAALSQVTLEGRVIGPDSSRAADFNGEAFVTVFDSPRRVMMPYHRWLDNPYFNEREDLIWRGLVDVSQGRFSAEFVAPKDISYSGEPGRISVYAQDAARTAGGFTEQVVIEGTAENPPDDQTGPDISLFINDTTFVSGGLVSEDPTLLVQLFDENGINVVGAGVGHEMLLTIDGEEQHAVDLSPYFVTEKNSYRRGSVSYELANYIDELEPGTHHLTVRAWDVQNNASVAELSFTLSESEGLEVRNLYNYPNPTTGPTEFIFEHNQPPMTTADVRIRIFTVGGQPVETLEPAETLPAGVLESSLVRIPWDGRDADGDQLAPGIYLYHVRIAAHDADGGTDVVERIEKVAVVR